MRVLCCPSQDQNLGPRPHPKTAESLALYAPDAEIIDVSGDPGAYWRTIRDRWGTGEDLVVVEHDIAFNADELSSFLVCPKPWCIFVYILRPKEEGIGYFEQGLGFARFRKELMARVPKNEIPCNHDGGISWEHVDSRIYLTCWRYGYRPHSHGPVKHYHYTENP